MTKRKQNTDMISQHTPRHEPVSVADDIESDSMGVVIYQQSLSLRVKEYIALLASQHSFNKNLTLSKRELIHELSRFWPELPEWRNETFRIWSFISDAVNSIPTVESFPRVLLQIRVNSDLPTVTTHLEPAESAAITTFNSTDGVMKSCFVTPIGELPDLEAMDVASGIMVLCQSLPPFTVKINDVGPQDAEAALKKSKREMDDLFPRDSSMSWVEQSEKTRLTALNHAIAALQVNDKMTWQEAYGALSENSMNSDVVSPVAATLATAGVGVLAFKTVHDEKGTAPKLIEPVTIPKGPSMPEPVHQSALAAPPPKKEQKAKTSRALPKAKAIKAKVPPSPERNNTASAPINENQKQEKPTASNVAPPVVAAAVTAVTTSLVLAHQKTPVSIQDTTFYQEELSPSTSHFTKSTATTSVQVGAEGGTLNKTTAHNVADYERKVTPFEPAVIAATPTITALSSVPAAITAASAIIGTGVRPPLAMPAPTEPIVSNLPQPPEQNVVVQLITQNTTKVRSPASLNEPTPIIEHMMIKDAVSIAPALPATAPLTSGVSSANNLLQDKPHRPLTSPIAATELPVIEKKPSKDTTSLAAESLSPLEKTYLVPMASEVPRAVIAPLTATHPGTGLEMTIPYDIEASAPTSAPMPSAARDINVPKNEAALPVEGVETMTAQAKLGNSAHSEAAVPTQQTNEDMVDNTSPVADIKPTSPSVIAHRAMFTEGQPPPAGAYSKLIVPSILSEEQILPPTESGAHNFFSQQHVQATGFARPVDSFAPLAPLLAMLQPESSTPSLASTTSTPVHEPPEAQFKTKPKKAKPKLAGNKRKAGAKLAKSVKKRSIISKDPPPTLDL